MRLSYSTGSITHFDFKSLSSYDYLFFPIHNSNPLHWSLLFYTRHDNKFTHFDPVRGTNMFLSLDMVAFISKSMNITNPTNTVQIACPQQPPDSGACDLYTAAYIHALLYCIQHKLLFGSLEQCKFDESLQILNDLLHGQN